MYCASLQSSSPVPGGRCELVWWSLIGPSWAQEMTHHQHVARTPGYHNVAAASHTCNIVGHLKFMSWLCYQVTKVLKLALMVTPSQTEPHGFAFPLPVELRLRWTWCQSTTHNVYQPLQPLFGPLITTTDGLATFSTLYKHFISLRFTFNWVTLLSWKCKDQLCWADLLSGVSMFVWNNATGGSCSLMSSETNCTNRNWLDWTSSLITSLQSSEFGTWDLRPVRFDSGVQTQEDAVQSLWTAVSLMMSPLSYNFIIWMCSVIIRRGDYWVTEYQYIHI